MYNNYLSKPELSWSNKLRSALQSHWSSQQTNIWLNKFWTRYAISDLGRERWSHSLSGQMGGVHRCLEYLGASREPRQFHWISEGVWQEIQTRTKKNCESSWQSWRRFEIEDEGGKENVQGAIEEKERKEGQKGKWWSRIARRWSFKNTSIKRIKKAFKEVEKIFSTATTQ